MSAEALPSLAPHISDTLSRALLLRFADTNRLQPSYSPRPGQSTVTNLLETSRVSGHRNLFKPSEAPLLLAALVMCWLETRTKRNSYRPLSTASHVNKRMNG